MHPTAPITDPNPGQSRSEPPSVLRYLISGFVLAALWIVLAGTLDPSSWIIGLPAVMAATWAHGRLSLGGGPRLSIIGGIRLLPVFLWGSLKGGIDVAGRVVGPRLNVEPGFFDYRLALTLPSARVFFLDLVSLLPGTLSADLQVDILRVHALDRRVDSIPELVRLEGRIAALFGDRLPDRPVPAP